MPNEGSLTGQVAWVTGFSRGLGRVLATKLCELGAQVAIHGTHFDSPKSFSEGDSMEQVARDVARAAAGVTMPVWGDVTD
jgi:3-oxoacyl-[acyl-carrier protein] reductase